MNRLFARLAAASCIAACAAASANGEAAGQASPSSAAAYTCDTVADSSRIAVAGGSLTEILYFLGVEDRIVAVDSTSNFPAEATELPSVGYVRALSAEGLMSLDPTLVLGENDMGPPEVLTMVRGAGVPVVRVAEDHTAAGIVDKVRCVATVLGIADAAAPLIDGRLLTTIAKLSSRPQTGRAARVAFFLQFRDGAPIGAGRDTSADGLLRMAGADNVLAAFEGWKPVSMEAMALAEPDFVVITERGVRAAGGAAQVLAHPAMQLAASRWGHESERRLIVMDGMTMLGFGPRTLGAALELAQQLRPDAT